MRQRAVRTVTVRALWLNGVDAYNSTCFYFNKLKQGKPWRVAGLGASATTSATASMHVPFE